MLNHYQKLLQLHADLEAEIEDIEGEEKKLHLEILDAVDKNKIGVIQDKIKNIKE